MEKRRKADGKFCRESFTISVFKLGFCSFFFTRGTFVQKTLSFYLLMDFTQARKHTKMFPLLISSR